MRVLVLNGGYLGASPSGGDRHLLALAEGLHDEPAVTSLALVAPSPARRWLPERVRSMVYRSRLPRSTIDAIWIYLQRTLRVCWLVMADKSLAADVVLTSPGLVDVIPAYLHKLRHRSRLGIFAFHIGDVRATGSIRRRFQACLSRLASFPARVLTRHADVVFTATRAVADQLIAQGVEPRQITLQRPIVDVETIRATPACEAPDVLFVGRLVARKGIFDLLDVARRTSFSVGIVGDGEEADELRHQIDADGLSDRVTLLGALPDNELYGLMRGTKVLVLPSYEEGYGLVIAEALVAETPVVAYELPHYDEVFGDAIVTVPKGDTQRLATALTDVLASPTTSPLPMMETRQSAATHIVENLAPDSSSSLR